MKNVPEKIVFGQSAEIDLVRKHVETDLEEGFMGINKDKKLVFEIALEYSAKKIIYGP